jgi:hypothetical protein
MPSWDWQDSEGRLNLNTKINHALFLSGHIWGTDMSASIV